MLRDMSQHALHTCMDAHSVIVLPAPVQHATPQELHPHGRQVVGRPDVLGLPRQHRSELCLRSDPTILSQQQGRPCMVAMLPQTQVGRAQTSDEAAASRRGCVESSALRTSIRWGPGSRSAMRSSTKGQRPYFSTTAVAM